VTPEEEEMNRCLRPVWALAIVAAGALLSPESAAQGAGDPAAEEKIDQAINQQYLATKFDEAEAILREALMTCGGDCSPAVQARIWMYLGIVLHTGKNDVAGTKEAFAAAVALDPAVKLDDGLANDETRKLFAEAAPAQPVTTETPAGAGTPGAKPGEAKPGEEEEAEEERPPGLFGQSGQVVLGAERLFGYYSWSYSLATYASVINPGTVYLAGDHPGTSFSVFGLGGSAPPPVAINVFASPRLGFDAFVKDNISVGLSAGLAGYKLAYYTETRSSSAYVVHLRGGYAFPFGSVVGVWPRIGFSIVSQKYVTEISDQTSGVVNVYEYVHSYQNLTIELPLVITPTEHIGLMLGGVIDAGLNGSIVERSTVAGTATETPATKSTFTSYGGALGVFVYF
jgi:hypothetical protein